MKSATKDYLIMGGVVTAAASVAVINTNNPEPQAVPAAQVAAGERDFYLSGELLCRHGGWDYDPARRLMTVHCSGGDRIFSAVNIVHDVDLVETYADPGPTITDGFES